MYNVTIDKTVKLGRYEQGHGIEPIEWIILTTRTVEQENWLLLMSRYCLDIQPYNTSKSRVTWENCTLRRWLNTDFMDTAFTDREKKLIREVEVVTGLNPSYHTFGGNITRDKVFLLNIQETEDLHNYIDINEEIECEATEYAKAQYVKALGAYPRYGITWWLRSPGAFDYLAAFASPNGSVSRWGSEVDEKHVGVRPVLWIDRHSYMRKVAIDTYLEKILG